MPLTRAVTDAVSVPVIASGGVGTLDDLVGVLPRAMPAPFWRHPYSISASQDLRPGQGAHRAAGALPSSAMVKE